MIDFIERKKTDTPKNLLAIMSHFNDELQKCFDQKRFDELDKNIVGISALAQFAKVNKIKIGERDIQKIQDGKIDEVIDSFSGFQSGQAPAAAPSASSSTSLLSRIFGSRNS